VAFIVTAYKGVQIVSIGEYVPKSTGANDEFSNKILAFKSGKEQAIDHFTKLIVGLLSSKGLKSQSVYVATIPSSTAKRAHAGFPSLIKGLSKQFSIQNPEYNLLRRTESKLAAHKGGDRSKSANATTLEIPNDIQAKISGKSVILLDDVTTTTNSLQAGIDKLMEAKAKVAIAVVLGRTIK